MHDLPTPRINKNSPAVMAARLAGYLTGVQAIGERLIEPAPTQRDIREAERDAHSEHVKHLKLRLAEGIPRIISRQSVDLLTHIRRVEYQLRCFILWLAAILIEKAQNNPEFHRSLFRDSRASAKAQAVELEARNKAEQYTNDQAGISFGSTQPDPRLRGDERWSLGDSRASATAHQDGYLFAATQATTQAQGVEPQAKNEPEHISDYIWKQELQMRRLAAKTFPIGGFSITTPVIEGTSRARRSRMRHLTPDSSRTVDASYLVARLARLPRILARADQMAERLARRALSQNALLPRGRRVWDEGETIRYEFSSSPHPNPSPRSRGEGLLRLTGNTKPSPNPLYFEPLTRIVPPDKLWNSTEDDEERGDMTWLHFIASDTLNRTGHAPGPDAGSYLPDLSRFEPPKPPQIRGT